MGGQAQPSAYRRPRRNLGGEDRRKHAADPDRGRVADALPRSCRTAEYRVGALLLDRENPLRVLARTPEPILEPEFFYETEGFYSHCVFPTGNVVVDGVLYVYYGGADKYVGVATCRLEELLNYLTEKCRCE